MKTLLITLLLALLTACGESTQKLKIEEPDGKVEVGGETYSYVVFQFEFITAIRQLCEDLNADKDFDTEEAYRAEVAQCTFDNLSVIDVGAVQQFNTDICNSPSTPEEVEICNALN